jgi:hypothetical protein
MPRIALPTTALLLLALAAAPQAVAGEPAAALPKDFRSWTHVRSMVVTDGDHGMYGFHFVYANPAALKVLEGGAKPPRYPDGAVFVTSIFEVTTRDGMTVAGPKQRDVVQWKDAKAKATGGWRFAAFDPSGKRIAVDQGTCFGCHAAAKDTDFVFATFTR